MLLVLLTCSAFLPSFAQRSRLVPSVVPSDPDYPTNVVEYERIKAFTDGQGVFIRWEMRSELNNMGFFVYKLGENGLEMVSPGMILGAFSRANSPLAGEGYEMFDIAGNLNTVYVIRNQFTNGNHADTASFSATLTRNFLADTGHTKQELEDLARNTNGTLKRDGLSLPSGLQAIVNQSILPPNPENQARVVTQQGVKILVKKEGMYRVTRAELEAAGFDVDSNPVNWRLFSDGNEQAIMVEPTGQYLDFYGKGLDTREADTRTYFLISDTVAGKRMISKFLSNIGGNVMSNNYRMFAENKERTNYDPTVKNGDIENYFGRPAYSSIPPCPSPNPNDPPCISVNLSAVDTLGLNATVNVKFQGLSTTPHNVRVILNGHEIGSVLGTHKDNFSGELSLPSNFLVEGDNVFQFATVQSADTVYFDHVKLTYSRRYAANQNRTLFFTPGYRKIDVTGFTSSNIRVFDTTLDGNPQLITGLPVTQNGGTYSVRMPSNRPAVMYAVEESGLLQVASVVPDSPSSLGTTGNVADFIIISYSAPDFMAAAEAWANYRRSQAGGGFTVKVVEITDVYDEFSYGAHSGFGIARFLDYAKNNWQTPTPRYVLLLGDASTDARNYTGLGYHDLVPSMHVSLIFEDTASDEAMLDFGHDGVADLAVGRVPARTALVVNTMLNKTVAFETAAMQSLDRGAVCAFDRPDGYDFDAMCHALLDGLPSGIPKTYVNRMLPFPNQDQPDPNGNQNLMNALNPGPYIVNYSGHGSAGVWGSANFFGSNHAPLLTNANGQSIFTMLTCLNGFFVWDRGDSLGEALVRAPNGGAAASWASTTKTTPDYQLMMGERFFRQVGLGNIKRLGDLVMDAKLAIPGGSDVGYSWVLLGDPAMKVRE